MKERMRSWGFSNDHRPAVLADKVCQGKSPKGGKEMPSKVLFHNPMGMAIDRSPAEQRISPW